MTGIALDSVSKIYPGGTLAVDRLIVPGQPGGLGGQRPDLRSQWGERVRQPGGREVGEIRMQRGQIVRGRILAILEDALYPAVQVFRVS
jgi:hypothetical protein